jgi:hypothetical protein
MCDEWRDNFPSFVEWSLRSGYSDELTLDRINNDGNYEPDNCRWVTMLVQANNKRPRIRGYSAMTHSTDSGPAFPSAQVDPFGGITGMNEGMSLRDYFAAKVLQGVCHANMLAYCDDYHGYRREITNAAALAYRLADAMLAARAQPPPDAELKLLRERLAVLERSNASYGETFGHE